jgi:leader peptidase (prepilin peptidase) / N-methyltransferase
VSSEVVAAAAAAGIALVASPYLARLTLSVPDKETASWLGGRPASRNRVAVTALVAVILGALAGAAADWSAVLPAFVAFAVFATPLVVIDVEHHRLPNRLIYPAGVAAAVLLTVAALVRHDWSDLLRALEGGAVVFAVFNVLWFIRPNAFGYGDVRLGAILGAYLGWSGWLEVYYGIFGGFVLGSVVSLALLATRRATLKSAMPFGPMLILGCLLVLALDLTPSFGN